MATAKSKQQSLDELQAKILADSICPELAAHATQLVFGDGSPDADIVFIGEAPGKNEDIQGKPFVGAAGKFLNEMLTSVGLERQDIYITNIVKYRPPGNRDPLPDEKKAFWPYLVRQLNIIQPRLVVTLGRHSMEYFLPEAKISAIHGEPKRIKLRLMSEEQGAKSKEQDSTTGSYSADESQQAQMTTDLDAATKRAGGQRADGVQDTGENRTEPYNKYGEGESQPVTQQSAARHGSVSGSARKQDMPALVILPLFHPAAALYNGGMRQTLLDDFARIPAILQKL